MRIPLKEAVVKISPITVWASKMELPRLVSNAAIPRLAHSFILQELSPLTSACLLALETTLH